MLEFKKFEISDAPRLLKYTSDSAELSCEGAFCKSACLAGYL